MIDETQLTIKRSPLEDILLPFTFGFASEDPEYAEREIEEQIQKLRILKREDNREYNSLINSLKVLLLTPRMDDKIAFLLSIPSLSMGFGIILEDVIFEETDTPEIRNVKIAQRLAQRILIELEEEISESL